MSVENEFPTHPFWDYSLLIYSTPGVADACLALQDDFGLDVNMVLFCFWCGVEGPGRLDSEQINACLSRTTDWQKQVIEPLRAVRRTCKIQSGAETDSFSQILRRRVQAVELDAEHVEQLVLAGIVENSPVIDDAEHEPADDAIHNIFAYLEALDVAADDQILECLDDIVSAVFPGANLSRPS